MGKRDVGKKADLLCSFCGKSQGEVEKIIAGPGVFICDECIELCNDIIAEECDKERNVERFCSFCGKIENKVKKLIQGPTGLYICNNCVSLCYDIIMADLYKYSRKGKA